VKALRAPLTAMALRMTERTRTVAIDRCYHYRAFRYGGHGNNLYEDYIRGLAAGQERDELRRHFAESILHCRPKTLGQALQIELGSWPLWEFPWMRKPASSVHYQSDPAAVADVVCQYSEQGVLTSHINREFKWLEAAYESIKAIGYQPQRFGYIRCVELRGEETSSFLVTDGNHRISALHAVGLRTVEVKTSTLERVCRKDVRRWRRVREGDMPEALALRVFDRYFAPENPPLPRLNPTTLVLDEPPAWPAGR